MRYGTAYFTDRASAEAYYKPYGFTDRDVKRKLNAGEIYIGKPPLKPGETCASDREGRYIITTKEP